MALGQMFAWLPALFADDVVVYYGRVGMVWVENWEPIFMGQVWADWMLKDKKGYHWPVSIKIRQVILE